MPVGVLVPDTNKGNPCHVTLQSHEDTRVYSNVYKYVKGQVGTPKYRMADGAKEITKAGEEVGIIISIIITITITIILGIFIINMFLTIILASSSLAS